MRVLSVSWSPSTDLTKIKFTDEFLSSRWVLRADVLRDLIYDLTAKYDLTLKEMTDPKPSKAK